MRPTTLASPAIRVRKPKKFWCYPKNELYALSANRAMACASAVLSHRISAFWSCDRNTDFGLKWGKDFKKGAAHTLPIFLEVTPPRNRQVTVPGVPCRDRGNWD